MNYAKLIENKTGKNVVYNYKSELNSNSSCCEKNFSGISDRFGNTNKKFIFQNNENKELYITENGFDYKKYIIGNNHCIKEDSITDPIVLSLQYLKKFISDMNINSFLYTITPICNIVDSIARNEQSNHILSKIYGLDYQFYNVVYDALIISKEYDKLWDLKYHDLPKKHNSSNKTYKIHIQPSEIINIKLFCSNKFVNAIEFLNIDGTTLKATTPFINKHYDLYSKITDQNLYKYFIDNDLNFIEFYIDKWINGDKDFFKPFIPAYKQLIKKRHYNSCLAEDSFIQEHLCFYKILKRDLLFYYSGYKYQYIEIDKMFNYIFYIINQEFMRDNENILRDEMNVPRIGEGWIVETELYYLIKNTFSTIEVQHHGKPTWLGKQHLDIYIPEFNIGIEYQGLQHFEPVKYFGGIGNYNKMIKLDKRKQELCKKNNCRLIYVTEGYNSTEVIDQISNLLKIINSSEK